MTRYESVNLVLTLLMLMISGGLLKIIIKVIKKKFIKKLIFQHGEFSDYNFYLDVSNKLKKEIIIHEYYFIIYIKH